MNLSIFLAQLFGLYLVIIACALFFRREFFRKVYQTFYDFPALVAVTAIINLLLGLLIVLNHNIWEFSWRVIITLIGYVSLFKGVMNLFSEDFGKKIVASAKGENFFKYSSIITLGFGLYLIYHGFFV